MKALLMALTLSTSSLLIGTPMGPQGAGEPQEKPPQKFADLTLVGCLVQGSSMSTFVLQNAKQEGPTPAEKVTSYLVVPASEEVDLKGQLNRDVRITGETDGRTPPAGGRAPEKDLPVLTAKSVNRVSGACSAMPIAGR